jgi:hypothetical protein
MQGDPDRIARVAILLAWLVCAGAAVAQDSKPVFPAADWERVPKPEAAGFSKAKLDVLGMAEDAEHDGDDGVSKVKYCSNTVTSSTSACSRRALSVLGMLGSCRTEPSIGTRP